MNKPLIVRKAVHSEDASISERQFIIQPQEYESEDFGDAYVCFSGYFGSYGPHVFAAAPELLEALEDTLCALEVCGRDYDYVMGKARAAIAKAKAKGETK